MIVTQFTRSALRQRRFERDAFRDGYEEVGENGGKLWEIYRGGRVGRKIVDAKVSPDGLSVFVKIEEVSGTTDNLRTEIAISTRATEQGE